MTTTGRSADQPRLPSRNDEGASVQPVRRSLGDSRSALSTPVDQKPTTDRASERLSQRGRISCSGGSDVAVPDSAESYSVGPCRRRKSPSWGALGRLTARESSGTSPGIASASCVFSRPRSRGPAAGASSATRVHRASSAEDVRVTVGAAEPAEVNRASYRARALNIGS